MAENRSPDLSEQIPAVTPASVSVTCFQLSPNPARYFLRRSESFVLFRFLKDSAKSVRPASDIVFECRQTRITRASCGISKRSRRETASSPSTSSTRSRSAFPSPASSFQESRRRRNSLSTRSVVMRPLSDSTAIRVATPERSRKLLVQADSESDAYRRNSSFASLFMRTSFPSFREAFSSSTMRFGSISFGRSLSPMRRKVQRLIRASRSCLNFPSRIIFLRSRFVPQIN